MDVEGPQRRLGHHVVGIVTIAAAHLDRVRTQAVAHLPPLR